MEFKELLMNSGAGRDGKIHEVTREGNFVLGIVSIALTIFIVVQVLLSKVPS